MASSTTASWFHNIINNDSNDDYDSQHVNYYHGYGHDNNDNARMLASEGVVKIDYNALSVGAMTLTLLLMVGFLRSRLDKAAHHRPFFHAVLEGVYTELATLGFVEFLLHLISEYYEKYDAAKKHVFGDVHFLLFYTAILNAFQTVLTAVLAYRVATKLWIDTELLELNHYVEIREEFDRLQQELDRLHNKNDPPHISLIEDRKVQFPDRRNLDGSDRPIASIGIHDEPYAAERPSLYRLLQFVRDTIRYPALRRKYDLLLTQVRFHDLRMHFIQSYNLPLQMKISDYLMQRQQNVLLKFVNVSSTAWVLLTAGVCLLYYVLGMVYYQYRDQELVGLVLTWIFFWCMLTSSTVLWVVAFKMQSTFYSIMRDKTLWDVHGATKEDKERLSKQQLALFWGSEPKNVLDFIQFLQFGYGLAVSTVVVFWEEMNDGVVGMHWYLIAIGFCYIHFVHVTGQVLPMYILCTSLGQLVDERVLHSTVAHFHLEEAKQKQLLEELEQQHEPTTMAESNCVRRVVYSPNITTTTADQVSPTTKEHEEKMAAELAMKLDHVENNHSNDGSIFREPRTRGMRKTLSEGVKAMVAMNNSSSLQNNDAVSDLPSSASTTLSGKRNTSSDDLVKTRPRRLDRHARKKSVSDGVAMMARISNANVSGETTPRSRPSPAQSRRNSRTGASSSTPVKVVDSGEMLAKLVALSTTDLRSFLPVPYTTNTDRRSGMKKSVSDGVSQMALSGMSGRVMGQQSFDERGMYGRESMDTLGAQAPNNNKTQQQRQERHRRKKSLSDGDRFLSNGSIQGTDSFDSTVIFKDVKSSPEKNESTVRSKSDHFVSDETASRTRGKPLVLENALDDMNGVKYDVEARAVKFTTPQALGEGRIPVSDRSEGHATDQHIDPSYSKGLYAYFLSKRHIRISNVFGTIFAFYLVANRIEGFLYSDEFPDSFVSLHLPLRVSFWILTFLLCSFVIASVMVLSLFHRFGNGRNMNELRVVTAAIVDIVISLSCLSILFTAEANRCCEAKDTPVMHRLAEAPDHSETSTIENGQTTCECPPFGNRSYGGLGEIEPYASLVFLRIVRHWIARRLVSKMTCSRIISKLSGHDGNAADHDHTEMASNDDPSKRDLPVLDHVTAVTEAWEATIVSRPDLVAQYGEFSGEILRAMLGVKVGGHQMFRGKDVTPDIETRNESTYVLGKEFAGLSVKAQEVILAGKLGRSLVRSKSMGNLPPPGITRSTMLEDMEVRSMEFEMKSTPDEPSGQDGFYFASPNARLICPMRRCDRKFLPFLDQWSSVDVAMTHFEIVYFDAVGVDAVSLESDGDGTRQALIATCGGEGLRICDVAVGRRIVGRLSLSDIVTVHVQRRFPEKEGIQSEADGIGDLADVVRQKEFWIPEFRNDSFQSHLSRGKRWSMMKQDSLAIETQHGHTLFLRFYVDLELSESQPIQLSFDLDNSLHEINAFLWARMIGRLCGRDQLKKQLLPHLGDSANDGIDEFKDYLVALDRSPEGSRPDSRRLLLKRHQSFFGMLKE